MGRLPPDTSKKDRRAAGAVTDDPKLRHDCVALPYERLPPDTSEAA
jgi:hypothetical protein